MNTTFKSGISLSFEDTNRYREAYISNFLRILGTAMAREYSKTDDKLTVGELASNNKSFSTLFLYLIRFSVYLIEKGDVDASALTQEDVVDIQSLDLPEEFIDYVTRTAFTLNAQELIKKTMSVSPEGIKKDESKRLIDKRKGFVIYSLGMTLSSLKTEIDDDVTIDDIMSNIPEFKDITLNSFKVALLVEQNKLEKTAEGFQATQEKLNSLVYKDADYQEIMFDVGQLTKVQILKLADEFGAPIGTSFSSYKKN